MDIASITNQILAILTVVSTVATLVFTVLKSRTTLKQDEIENTRSKNNVGIEATERLNTVSLSMVNSLKEQLSICENRRLELEKQTQSLSLENTDLKIRVRRLAFSIRDIIEKHDDLSKENGQDKLCPVIPILNSMLLKIVEQIEKEIEI